MADDGKKGRGSKSQVRGMYSPTKTQDRIDKRTARRLPPTNPSNRWRKAPTRTVTSGGKPATRKQIGDSATSMRNTLVKTTPNTPSSKQTTVSRPSSKMMRSIRVNPEGDTIQAQPLDKTRKYGRSQAQQSKSDNRFTRRAREAERSVPRSRIQPPKIQTQRTGRSASGGPRSVRIGGNASGGPRSLRIGGSPGNMGGFGSGRGGGGGVDKIKGR